MNLKDIPKKFLVSKSVRKKRLTLCKACEDLNILQQCKHCLCFVHAKTWLKSERCEKPKEDERKW